MLGAAAVPFLTPAPALAAVPSSGHLNFAAIREGKKIGEHHFTFQVAGDVVTVHSEADFTVSLGPVPIVKYHHRCTEHWRGDQCESLDSRTTTNGSLDSVAARRTASGVSIQSAKLGHVSAPANANPLTHWNWAGMRMPLYNPQSGHLFKGSVSKSPTKVMVSGDAQVTEWYDSSGVLSGLKGIVKQDNSWLEYRRI
jgi:hypothetical protein